LDLDLDFFLNRYKSIINHKIFNGGLNYGAHMVEIEPFRGFRFNPQKIDDFSSVIAPPYDVIDQDMQTKLQAHSEYNISKITKGVKFKTDTESDNEYT
jgi:hypothetical protein